MKKTGKLFKAQFEVEQLEIPHYFQNVAVPSHLCRQCCFEYLGVNPTFSLRIKGLECTHECMEIAFCNAALVLQEPWDHHCVKDRVWNQRCLFLQVRFDLQANKCFKLPAQLHSINFQTQLSIASECIPDDS